MSVSGVLVSECKCEKPDFVVCWKTRMCAVCHKAIKSIDVVLCKKCGGKVPLGGIPEEIKKQEQDCGHNVLDGEFERFRDWE